MMHKESFGINPRGMGAHQALVPALAHSPHVVMPHYRHAGPSRIVTGLAAPFDVAARRMLENLAQRIPTAAIEVSWLRRGQALT